MSTLNVDKVDPNTGTALEIGSSGDTITIPSGATIVNSGTATGFGAALTGSSDNTMVTVTGANAMQGETNFTCDSTTYVKIKYQNTAPTETAMGTAHADDAVMLLGGANSGTTQGSLYLGGQSVAENGVCGAVYGFSGGSQNAGLEFLEGTSDAYGQIKMSVAQGTGGTLVEVMKIDNSGAVTKPLQPAFKITQTGALSVADGHTLFSSNTTEVKDVNGDWASGTFTAPVDGFYFISVSVLYESIGSGDTDTVEDTFIFSNGNEIISRAGKLNNALSSGGYMESAKALISYMDASDTVYCQHGDGGTLAVHANAHASHFEGCLLG